LLAEYRWQQFSQLAAHRYRIPRFVCGLAWQDERGFARILDGLTAA
jgi:hypothetical protein